MIDMSYEQVVKAVQKLRPEQKAALVKTVKLDPLLGGITRAQLLAETEALRAVGAFDRVDSLRNRFANSATAHLTDRQLLLAIHESSIEWETGLTEIGGLEKTATEDSLNHDG